MPKINYQLFFKLVLFLTIIKILISIYFGDELIDMEWRIINQNLIEYGEFTYHEIGGIRVPSIYMPPLYPYFLYSFSFFGLDQIITTKLIKFCIHKTYLRKGNFNSVRSFVAAFHLIDHIIEI